MSTESRIIPVGSPAPDFTLASASVEEITLSAYRGRSCVVLVFLRGFT
jgi:peroxiredoxin